MARSGSSSGDESDAEGSAADSASPMITASEHELEEDSTRSPRQQSSTLEEGGKPEERVELDELSEMNVEHAVMVRQALDRADDLENCISELVSGEVKATLERKAIRIKMEIIDWMNVWMHSSHSQTLHWLPKSHNV
eukprot:scaffold321996_cov33-Tisochrysis_lutea.AAC.1